MKIKHQIMKAGITAVMWVRNLFRRTHMPRKHMDKFTLPIDEFNDLVNSYEYKADPLGGLIDIVGRPEKFFDEDKKYNRDCDNFMNVICVNAVLNGYRADEYIVTNPTTWVSFFKRMHVVAVLEKDGEFILANYRLYRGFKTRDDALAYLSHFKSYKDARIVVHSREIKLKK